MRVFMVGFMGSGKSHHGKQLADRLRFDFVDLDDVIEQQGRSIPAIFSDEGDFRFREIERDTLRALDKDDVVIATGGGTPCFHQNIEWMKEQGKVIYLKAPVDLLAERIRMNKEERPLVADVADEELPAFVAQLLKERESWYVQAHLTYHI